MKKLLLLIGFATLTMNGQVKKNKSLKHYTSYECRNDVDIEEFVKSNDYLGCDKSSEYRFYDVSISDNKIIITEYNKMEQVQNKWEHNDLVVEHKGSFDVYTKDEVNNDGNQGFESFYVSKDRKKIINYYINSMYNKSQTVYILK
ncbi:hypothetical protein [Flavobacterium sp.]|uniref:hypothetical protein n=1 Tax=Flavobacterium sp. TaxID=239 RepID=UPI001B750308|nr:hypothetical protein [Flavobacterium sp.]MBP6127483.1 hypothetical protein [Flavobacterium sp.]